MMKILNKVNEFIESVNYESGLKCEEIEIKEICENVYKGYLIIDKNKFEILVDENKFMMYDDNEVFVNDII